MLKVSFTLLIIGLQASDCFDWDSKTCQDLFRKEGMKQGTGCVKDGSLKVCENCVTNDQCASGVCSDDWKKCVNAGSSSRCYLPMANCGTSCTSDGSTSLGNCKCENEDFPNNWVKCNNGSSGFDVYNATATTAGYERKQNQNGGLRADDEFAIQAICYHNMLRYVAGVPQLKWSEDMATEFSHPFVSNAACPTFSHSTNQDRENIAGFDQIGENLKWQYASGGFPKDGIPKLAKEATMDWFNEIKYYQYPGQGVDSDSCETRNHDGESDETAHMTQVLWESTTHMSCDYRFCDDFNFNVACHYGPGGNIYGRQAFSSEVRCHLDAAKDINPWGLPSCNKNEPPCPSN